MTLSRIAVQSRIWFLGKCRFNLRLCSLGNELILLGQMHENRRMQPIDLSQIFLSIAAVIPDRGIALPSLRTAVMKTISAPRQ